MKSILKLIGVAGAVAALLVLTPAGSNAQGGRGKGKGQQQAKAAAKPIPLGPVTGDVGKGRELYYVNGCYGCHGYNGETGARDLVGTNSAIIANEDTFLVFLRQRADQAPISPSTRMPNFPKEAISDKEAKDIYAFIRSFRLDAPAVADIPTLQKILQSADKPYTK